MEGWSKKMNKIYIYQHGMENPQDNSKGIYEIKIKVSSSKTVVFVSLPIIGIIL